MQIKYHDETKRKKFQSNLSNFHRLNEGKKKIEKKKHTHTEPDISNFERGHFFFETILSNSARWDEDECNRRMQMTLTYAILCKSQRKRNRRLRLCIRVGV